jgi:hypothetical protein
MWNPVGFPDLFYDEGVYMRRAMHVLNGLGPQETNNYYDHPFFGQIFLASVFKLINYPNIVVGNSNAPDVISIEMLYLVPRGLMGVLAVFDTFLVFKICERLYGRNAAIVSSALFAVMPITWITRRILLDSILLPFLLVSILCAIYSVGSKRRSLFVALSGISLGIAIFTKIPVFAMIPLVSYIIFPKKNPSDGNKVARKTMLKHLTIWIIPLIVIPGLWPLQSIVSGNFDSWLNTVLWQTQRGDRIIGLRWIIGAFWMIDPFTLALGALGGIYAAIRRNWFIIIWGAPYLVFLGLIGQTGYFNWVPLLPSICIATALVLLQCVPVVFRSTKHARAAAPVIIISILITGFAFTMIIISVDVGAAQRNAALYVLSYVTSQNRDEQLAVISSPIYSWIFKYAYGIDNALDDYRDVIYFPVDSPDWILVADLHYRFEMTSEPILQRYYNESRMIETFDNYPSYDRLPLYPKSNFVMTQEGEEIQIRISK